MLTLDEFDNEISTRGWALFESVVPTDAIESMRESIESNYRHLRPLQIANGVGKNTEFTVHHLPEFAGYVWDGVRHNDWLRYLDSMAVAPYIERYFYGPYILNSFGGALNQAHSKSYAHEIHRDQRSWSSDRLMLNTLVMLDDFTEDNGATWLMQCGQHWISVPDEDTFNSGVARAIGPAGSVVMWDSRLWHRGGENRTDKPRRSVTPIFSRPWMRQEFDYARALGGDGSQYSPALRQVLGYNSRTPSTLSEFYQPKESRMYRGDQG